MWRRVMAAVARKPAARIFVLGAFVQYMQIRHMYDRGQFWEPQLAAGGYRPTSSMLDARAASPER